MTHVTCRLTAKNQDQLLNLTLGNRVWAIFTFFFTLTIDSVTSLHPLLASKTKAGPGAARFTPRPYYEGWKHAQS